MVRAEDHDNTARTSAFMRPDNADQGWWARGVARRKEQKLGALQQRKLAQLALLGIHPDSLAGRLRLVLTIGCYNDFRFTRDILSSGAAHNQVEQAIERLVELGAHCDCEVFRALGQLPRSVLWHINPLLQQASGPDTSPGEGL